MFLFNSVGFADLFGIYMFAIDAADFWFGVFGTLVLAYASVVLAVRPQPVPKWQSGRR